MSEPEWKPIETAPRNNTWFDVRAMTPMGEIAIVEKVHYLRMFSEWQIWGMSNRLSSYFKPLEWRSREQHADMGG
jgi:hypothetical protein